MSVAALRALLMALGALLAGCQSAAPPASGGTTTTVGATTITTSGSVRADAAYVR